MSSALPSLHSLGTIRRCRYVDRDDFGDLEFAAVRTEVSVGPWRAEIAVYCHERRLVLAKTELRIALAQVRGRHDPPLLGRTAWLERLHLEPCAKEPLVGCRLGGGGLGIVAAQRHGNDGEKGWGPGQYAHAG